MAKYTVTTILLVTLILAPCVLARQHSVLLRALTPGGASEAGGDATLSIGLECEFQQVKLQLAKIGGGEPYNFKLFKHTDAEGYTYEGYDVMLLKTEATSQGFPLFKATTDHCDWSEKKTATGKVWPYCVPETVSGPIDITNANQAKGLFQAQTCFKTTAGHCGTAGCKGDVFILEYNKCVSKLYPAFKMALNTETMRDGYELMVSLLKPNGESVAQTQVNYGILLSQISESWAKAVPFQNQQADTAKMMAAISAATDMVADDAFKTALLGEAGHIAEADVSQWRGVFALFFYDSCSQWNSKDAPGQLLKTRLSVLIKDMTKGSEVFKVALIMLAESAYSKYKAHFSKLSSALKHLGADGVKSFRTRWEKVLTESNEDNEAPVDKWIPPQHTADGFSVVFESRPTNSAFNLGFSPSEKTGGKGSLTADAFMVHWDKLKGLVTKARPTRPKSATKAPSRPAVKQSTRAAATASYDTKLQTALYERGKTLYKVAFNKLVSDYARTHGGFKLLSLDNVKQMWDDPKTREKMENMSPPLDLEFFEDLAKN